ncbi:MAG: hypothetical protein JWP44_143 [Mucilaginibacter sp.]|nr:hypothetical protein [Mucilaginibacter sp.]
MYFVFSKLLLIFILPLTWILVFIIAALIIRRPKQKRRFLIISTVLLLLFTNPFILDRYAGLWDVKPIPLKSDKPYSCAIVLGGFAGEDAKGNGAFNGAADRFIQGLKLLATGKVSHILISGGNGNLIPDHFEESDWVKTQLLQLKVPDSCILIENRSRNTIENAAFSKAILIKKSLQPPYVLVTSAFHMRRSLMIFKKEKIEVMPYPCNYITGKGDFSPGEFIPDGGVLGTWNIYTKELVGMAVNSFK